MIEALNVTRKKTATVAQMRLLQGGQHGSGAHGGAVAVADGVGVGVAHLIGVAGGQAKSYFPVALIRPALVGSVPRVTLTFIPGFNSAAVALIPFTVISVN